MIVEATREHALAVLERIRPEVKAEGMAITSAPLVDMMDLALRYSVRAWVWIPEDRPAAIWGVGLENVISNVGAPWLITTAEVDRRPIEFARGSRRWVGLMRGMFPILENYVDARYVRCVKWLCWLGFDVYYPQPYGHLGLPFHRFRMG